jgi:hypothetical protein
MIIESEDNSVVTPDSAVEEKKAYVDMQGVLYRP